MRRRDKTQMAELASKPPPVWYTTAIFIIVTHIAALYFSILVSPWTSIPVATRILCFVTYQLGVLGYLFHLFSHTVFSSPLLLKGHHGCVMSLSGLGEMFAHACGRIPSLLVSPRIRGHIYYASNHGCDGPHRISGLCTSQPVFLFYPYLSPCS
jgi:hypothetical protein